MAYRSLRSIGFCLLGAVTLAGCTAQVPPPKEKPPLPVSVRLLNKEVPHQSSQISGSVVSWKTEQIGFEVAGRVSQVIEPNESIEGRIFVPGQKTPLFAGTPLARLEDSRFHTDVQSAEAAVEVTQRKIEAMTIEIEQRLPALVAAAEAERDLAKIEQQRNRNLRERNAASQSALDRAETTLITAQGEVARQKAELASRKADLRSLEAESLQAKQRLANAKRDLADTVLYSSFRGQVAETHVLPGSYVQPGDPAVTVQLMDPMSVEFELSAEASRKLNHGDMIRIDTVDRNQKKHQLSGIIHQTDAVADPQTRTFTVKLLVRNQQVQREVPEDIDSQQVARTSELFPLTLGTFLDGKSQQLIVEKNAIHHDSQGSYVWRVLNRKINEPTRDQGPLLRVAKMRVVPEAVEIPFLGNWMFVPVEIPSSEQFDPDNDLVVGKISLPNSSTTEWEGDTMLLDHTGWLLRPGDLVQVQLNSSHNVPGYYVPLKAIRSDARDKYLFIVDNSSSTPIARRVNVRLDQENSVFQDSGALIRVEATEGQILSDGLNLIVDGAHYLKDGDRIVIIHRPGAKS